MKKYLSFLLVAVLVLSQFSVMAATVTGTVYSDDTVPGLNKPPTEIEEELAQAGVQDVDPEAWYAGSMTVLIEQGFIKPDATGNVQPQTQLDTGTSVGIFTKVLGLIQKDDTEEAALAAAKANGLVEEDKELDDLFTRLDVAKMLAKAYGLVINPMSDLDEFFFADEGLSAEDKGLLQAMKDYGLFVGYPDGTFRPGNVLTRAEVALLVDRILARPLPALS